MAEIDHVLPGYGAMLREVYSPRLSIKASRSPSAAGSSASADNRSFFHESLVLPLGETARPVDHILVIGVYAFDHERQLCASLCTSLECAKLVPAYSEGRHMALDIETRDQLIETVRRFVREKCVPIEAKVSEEDRVPDAIIAEMRELGLFGLSIPHRIWRPRPHHGGRGSGLLRARPDLARVPLGHRHQCRHRQPGRGDVRHRGAEERMAAETGERRSGGELRADRAGRGLRCGVGEGQRRSATATTTSSTAPSASSPTPTAPACSR